MLSVVSCLFSTVLGAAVLSTAAAAASRVQPLASLYGDPHFQGADGARFHFSGQPGSSYCLISDPTFHVNVGMAGHVDQETGASRTWVKSLGVVIGPHALRLEARGVSAVADRGDGFISSLTWNGREARVDEGRQLDTSDGLFRLEHLGVSDVDGLEVESLRLVLNDGATELVVKARPEAPDAWSDSDVFVHLCVEVISAKGWNSPHGILGQTFRPDAKTRLEQLVGSGEVPESHFDALTKTWSVGGDNAEGYLEGGVRAYETSGVLQPDCKMSRYLPPGHTIRRPIIIYQRFEPSTEAS